MSKFNSVKTPPKPDTINFHGKPAYSKEAKSELAGILLTSFLEDQFYRSGNQTQMRLVELVGLVDPLFVAKAAIFARKTFGMRSVTHVVAGELAQYASGSSWLRRFYANVVVRPDDVTEILSYYLANRTEKRDGKRGKRPRSLSKAMQRGLGDALCRFGAYQLGKYKASSKDLSMVDAINLLRPHKTEAKGALLAGTLSAPNTWEVNLTKAGQSENKEEAKAEVWSGLLNTGQLGMLAAIRNIRNIVKQAPDAIPMLCDLLTNEDIIKKNKIFPFQYMTAWDVLDKDTPRSVRVALSQAFDKALGNLPKLEGRTLIAVDASGSMRLEHFRVRNSSADGTKYPLRTAAIFAAALYKRNDADVLWFSGGHDWGFYKNGPDASYCDWVTLNPTAPVLDLAKQIENESVNGNTDFRLIFSKLTKPYDRIIILTDEQSWVGNHYAGGTPAMDGLKNYSRQFSCDPWAYSIDLTGYGTSQFISTKITQLYGLSEKLFSFMENAERGIDAIVDEIERVEF